MVLDADYGGPHSLPSWQKRGPRAKGERARASALWLAGVGFPYTTRARMIITDSKGSSDGGGGGGGEASVVGGYSIDDPWTSSASPSRAAPSTSARPMTWAHASDRGSTHDHQSSDMSEAGPASVKMPAVYERAWEMCRSAEQGGDVDISLGQLGKVVRCAQSLGAADIERIINLACASSSSHCSKHEFAMALLLVAQVQSGQAPDARTASQKLFSGDDLDEPELDFGKLQSSTLRSKTTPSAAPSQRHYATVSSHSNVDPWETSATHQKTGLPASSSTFPTSALRAWGQGEREGEEGRGTQSPLQAPVYVNPNPTAVHLLPELGGYLFFRHVLYLVKTPLSSGVKRRYSDFVSLHDYLIARYPFRLIPPLPPKRLALPHMNRTQAVGSGQQDVFLEQRRLALARYTRNVISHPVLCRDAVIVSFYSTGGISGGGLGDENASSWKGPGLSDTTVEEGLDEAWKLNEAELMNVPVDMEDKLVSTRKVVSVVVDRWNNAVAVFERQVRRMEAMAAESTRLSLSLSSLLEVESQTYQGGARPHGHVFEQSTTLLVSNSQDYSDLSTARFHSLQHTLDGLKNARDVWLSLKDLFRRHERLGGDPIRELQTRIENNRKRWKVTIEEKKPGWKETCTRLKEDIELDQKLIERFERRNKRVRVALWHEVVRLQELKNLLVVDWRAYARSEAVNLAATKQAAEELAVALDELTKP